MNDHSQVEAEPDGNQVPFGTLEILAAVAGAERVLDAGCGSGRLTVALADTGAAVTGIDTNVEQLEQARGRAEEAGVELTLLEADFNAPLPFADASFDAVTSRLALMAAGNATATLRELRRVLEPGGRLVTALWATPAENPWFAIPREAIGAVLGPERASFARAFGKLGDPEEAAAVHCAAGLSDVVAARVEGIRVAPDAASFWRELAAENGHFRRVAGGLNEDDAEALAAEMEARLEPYRTGDRLVLPRALVLVAARSSCGVSQR